MELFTRGMNCDSSSLVKLSCFLKVCALEHQTHHTNLFSVLDVNGAILWVTFGKN